MSGLTQTEWAERMGLQQGSVQPWLAKKDGTAPDAGSLALIARTYNISGTFLLTGQLPIEPPGEPPDLRSLYEAAWRAGADTVLQAGAEAAKRPTELSAEEVKAIAGEARAARRRAGKGRKAG